MTAAASLLSTIDADPHAWFEAARAKGDVVWDEGMGGWILLSYDLCRHVEEREDLFRHPYSDATEVLLDIKGGPRNITVLQGEQHVKLRSYLTRMFAPRLVQEYTRDFVVPICDHVFGQVAPRGKAELAADVADQIPPRIFVALMGMDWRDEGLVRRELELHHTVMDWIGGLRTEEATRKAREASHELNAILAPQVRRRRTERGGDIISRLWAEAPEVFADVSEEDITAIGRELFLAGSDTSVHAIANAYQMLLAQPQLAQAVAADRGAALDTFIEESLRLLTVVQYRFRVANQDCALGGVQIKRNDVVIPVNAAANRDPARFECPHLADLQRKQARSHLAFNMGPRTCIGASLARAELRHAVNYFFDRLPNARLDPAAPAPVFSGFYTRSYRPLHVLFDAQAG